MLGSPTKQGLQVDFGRQFWRELEDAGPDSGHSHRLNACFLRNPKRLTDSEVKVTFRVVVIDVAGFPCMDDVRIWKFEPWGHNGRSKSDWRVSAAALFHFRSGGGGDVTELLTSLSLILERYCTKPWADRAAGRAAGAAWRPGSGDRSDQVLRATREGALPQRGRWVRKR